MGSADLKKEGNAHHVAYLKADIKQLHFIIIFKFYFIYLFIYLFFYSFYGRRF